MSQIDSNAKSQINIADNINTVITAEPLGFQVNTTYREFKPLVSPDGLTLYFSRQYYPGNTGGIDDPEDIWFCEFDQAAQKWTEAINIGSPLNTPGPNFVSGVGKDGDTLLLGNTYTKKGKLKAGVSISVRIGVLWSQPEQIQIEYDYNMASRSSYDVSPDRNAIFIAQQKIDSYGGLDLYVALRDPEGKFTYTGTESINLGPVINTSGDESSPFLADDSRTLYFSSDGHNGYGEHDIFVSYRLDETWTNWSEPKNLGPGINTNFDDLFFNFSSHSKYAYYSKGISPSNVDVFRIDMTKLFKEVSTSYLNLEHVDIPVSVGQTIRIRGVFEEEETIISENTRVDLENVLKFLKKNPNSDILIGTHSSWHKTRETSLNLSNERAEAVRSFFITGGISQRRLQVKGNGHDLVINSNVAEEANKISQLVEIKFIR